MSRRVPLLLVAALVLAAGAVAWHAAFRPASAADAMFLREIAAIAEDRAQPVFFLAENEGIDQSLSSAGAASGEPLARIIQREPSRIEEAWRRGTLLAGPHGADYLAVLGYDTVPLEQDHPGSLQLVRAGARLRCTAIRQDVWSPLPGLEYTGRLGVVLPASAGGSMVLVVGDQLPLDVQIADVDGHHTLVEREALTSLAAAPPDYWLESGSPYDVPPDIQQFTVFADPARERHLMLRLGRRAPRVLVRLQGYAPLMHAAVCAAPAAGAAVFVDDTSLTIEPTDAPYFGAGWSDVLDDGEAGRTRWMGSYGALLVPFARRGDTRIGLRAYRHPDLGPAEVSLQVNGLTETARLPLTAGVRDYEWVVPASAWAGGTNEILIQVRSQGDERLLALSRLSLQLSQQ
jgi:hypothetical protein